MPEIKTRLLEKRQIAENLVEVYFGVPENFKFEAGQYISVTLPELEALPVREQFRDFSISSSPKLKGKLRVTFRQSDSIFKQTLLSSDAPEVIIEGPAGVFTLPKNKAQKVIAIAGGIGITPFMSMLGENPDAFELIYFNNKPQTTAYLPELSAALGEKLNAYYTRPDISHFQTLAARNPNALWYVAGPPPMVANIRQLLKTLIIDDTLIRTEEFSGYE